MKRELNRVANTIVILLFVLFAYILGAFLQWQNDKYFYATHDSKPQTMTLTPIEGSDGQ